MFNWELVLDEQAIASVLPAEYARFARPVRDALRVFLEGLSEIRQQEILEGQAALPLDASISRRLGVLARSCPVLHKLGQILARDQRLAAEFREQLQQLESLPPTVPLDEIEATLARELGDLGRLGLTLEPPAIAEASVAVVIPFAQSAASGKPQRGVFKILKPGIEERLHEELRLMEQVGAYLDQRCEELDIPHLDYQETFEQVRDKLSCEVQLDGEQQHLAQARTFYADEPRVQIPALLEHCTPRVTAMERVAGSKVTEHLLDHTGDKRRLAELVVEALIARPIFSTDAKALFHSDPHAGNLMLTDDNRLAILDWSLVGSLSERQRVAVVQVMVGALTLHAARIVAALETLAVPGRLDRAALEATVEAHLRRIGRGQFPGPAWLISIMDDAAQTARLRFTADLMLFRKSLHTLEGVVAELDADGSEINHTLAGEFLRHFTAEWPWRWMSPPDSRRFATRLSNIDLAQTMLSLPYTAARFCVGRTLDLLSGVPQS